MKKITVLLLLFVLLASQSSDAQSKSKEVYRTKKGEKYHLKECKTIKDKKAYKVTLKEARKKGFQACKVCKPLSKKPVIKEEKSTNKTEIKSKKKVTTRCTGITLKGERCKRMTKNENGKCFQHQHQHKH